MGQTCFRGEAGSAGEGSTFPLLFDPGESDCAAEFAQRFETRFGHQPDYAAAHAYDATCLVVAAIRQAGLNRARIRDALATLSPWQGVTGTVHWDPTGQNDRPILLGTIAGGRVVAKRGGVRLADGSAMRGGRGLVDSRPLALRPTEDAPMGDVQVRRGESAGRPRSAAAER